MDHFLDGLEDECSSEPPGSCPLPAKYNSNLTYGDMIVFATRSGCHVDKDCYNATQEMNEIVTDVEGNAIDTITVEEQKFIQSFTRLPELVRKEIGHGFRDLVRECHFMGVDCRKEELFRLDSFSSYGNCFTFNHVMNQERDPEIGTRYLAITGSHHGEYTIICSTICIYVVILAFIFIL